MIKSFKIIALAGLTMLVFSQPAMAREFADIYTECGLGAMIAPRNEAVAAVTNVTWDSGTTAISSNITSPDTCQGGQAKTAAFIHDSYELLASDLSSGNGAYLDTLFVLTGFAPQSQQELTETLRADFAKTVAEPSYSTKSRFEKAEILYNLIYKNS